MVREKEKVKEKIDKFIPKGGVYIDHFVVESNNYGRGSDRYKIKVIFDYNGETRAFTMSPRG